MRGLHRAEGGPRPVREAMIRYVANREPSNSSTSPSSGKRPSSCFEKIVSPFTTTSYWLFAPSRGVASNPFSVNSAARLAARRSYPLQTGQ
jgi:hypothetical protein